MKHFASNKLYIYVNLEEKDIYQGKWKAISRIKMQSSGFI